MNRDRDKGAKSGANRSQKPLRAQHQHQHQHQVQTQRRRKEPAPKDALSDTSNSSEDLSKDSGCLSGKLSSSDSSSEVSDCPSEGNKLDSPSCEISWIDGAAYVSPAGDGTAGSEAAAPAAAAGGGLVHSAGSYLDHLMMGDTAEDLVREVDDLRSENEYLKDEVEELRCEMLEMRDMFQEEEVYQLQELRLQLEQANKTCRILQYRLRKAERRSIRVAQTGQVDGELVRGLEHDIRVAKSVSLRLYSELELVQKKNGQLEWENEALREKTQELEVARQVLKAEVEKARETTTKKKSIRSSSSKAEKRLSQQIEDDSADLRCQLHFAKEELALMCKKLTKLVSESEAMREELAKYRSAYGDVDAAQSPEGRHNSAHAREAEVKVHLKLVEEEATLLSRRIVELEVENRGLRAEMSDLREKVGRGGGGGGGEEEEEEENRDVVEENPAKERPGGGLVIECMVHEEASGKNKGEMETSQAQTEGTMAACQITREGPVGGEWDPSDSPERENNINPDAGLKGMMMKDYESLQALRDHSCILSSAIQLLTATPKNGHCSSPSCALSSPTDGDLNGKSQKIPIPGPLSEALELLQAMLLAFIGRVETLLTEDDLCKLSKQDCVEDLRTAEVKERDKQMRKASSFQWELVHNCKDSKVRLCLQILGILHQWCEVKGPGQEGNEGKDKALLVLRGLLQDLGAELRDERIEFDREAKNTQSKAAESAVNSVFHDDRSRADRTSSVMEKRRRMFSPNGRRTKNWCYVSQEAAEVDREDPVKTWDHLIMPLSFPHLDFEKLSLERSHTAPERSSVRIYYSPPSARRVQLAQPKQSSEAEERERESVNTTPPWCTPPTSFSSLRLLGSTGNLSEDAVAWRPEKKGRSQGRWVEMSCSGAQSLSRPQMVSVGLQTEAPPPVRGSPSRTSLASARSHHLSTTSLEGVPGRVERSRASTSSPKLYRRHSTSGAASPPAPANLSPSSSSSCSSTSSKERALWNLNHHSHSPLSWTKQASHRAGGAAGSTKPPSKPAGVNRYGAVTEFLRRVSGRAERPVSVPVLGQKTKSGLKNLERIPARPPSAPLQRNDSVTRIVNQRFMRQREERGSSGSTGSSGSSGSGGSGGSHGVRQSPGSSTNEDRNYDCSSSSSLTFCFARSSRSAHRPAANQGKLQRHRESPPARAAAASQT